MAVFLGLLRCAVFLSHAEKRAESRHPDARYLIITRVEPAAAAAAAAESSPAAAAAPNASDESVVFEGTPIGFCQMRFTTGDEDHAPIAYVYEQKQHISRASSDNQRTSVNRALMRPFFFFLRVLLHCCVVMSCNWRPKCSGKAWAATSCCSYDPHARTRARTTLTSLRSPTRPGCTSSSPACNAAKLWWPTHPPFSV